MPDRAPVRSTFTTHPEMTTREATMLKSPAQACPTCRGRGVTIKFPHESHNSSRAGRPVKEYCDSCLSQGHCPVCGGPELRNEETERFEACRRCGYYVELVGLLVFPTRFDESSGARRLTSAIAPSGGIILRYLTGDGLFVEFSAAGAWLRYRRSYWQGQALTEAAQAMVEAFDDDIHIVLSPWLSENLFEDMRASLDDPGKLKQAAEAVTRAYQGMPYDHPFGRGLNNSHFDMLKDALTPPAHI